jgi:hypothetical protein
MAKQENKKAEAPKQAAQKNPRSDTLPRREYKLGREHHTVLSGRVDRGLETSFFEVVSTSRRTGEIIRTRHSNHMKAVKAAMGRRANHVNIVINDLRPASVLARASDRLSPVQIGNNSDFDNIVLGLSEAMSMAEAA